MSAHDLVEKRRSKFMGRIDGPARLMIVSDLDQTMVDREDPENLSLLRFNSLWEAYYRQDSLLVYSTGRSLVKYKELRKKKPILTPDIAITSVGTEILYGELMVPDDEWVQYLNQKWDRTVVKEEAAKFPELIPRSQINQGPHKVSFDVEWDKALKIMNPLYEILKKRGLDVKMIYSNGIELDILPQGAGKGAALAYLHRKFELDGKLPTNTLVCGDSGNDADMFTIPEVYGVMVSNALDELLEWHALNAKDNPNIIHATERGAAGIIQAIGMFSLGPNVSPRDIRDFLKYEVDIFNPGHEVVRMFLLYERWRRAEVENSEQYIQHLKSVFYPSGTFVHPSGVQLPIHHCIDRIESSYGDKQGKQFRIWVDQVSSVRIGLDAWLVKFNKLEFCDRGNRRVHMDAHASDMVGWFSSERPNNMAFLTWLPDSWQLDCALVYHNIWRHGTARQLILEQVTTCVTQTT